MSPLKRRSELISTDGSDEEIDDTTPQSSNSHSSRKRRRASDDSLLHKDSPSDDRDDDDDEEEEETPPSSLGSENEAEYEEAATQAIREKHARNPENIAAECGILESVWVVNFMCHKNYEFELGPLINFICGKNGSGKSAILTAIQLCLGGKASATNRGQSLKTFIREGSEIGSITVKIKNQGSGAYMAEEYGDTIIVERHFSRSGASGFKIKSARGRLISTKKMDLEEICDHFSLQIDNPLNVLSQDMARQFITSSSASEKYKFFVKGVQLEQLDQDYRLIEDYVDNIEAKIDSKRPDVEELKTKMERAKQKQAMSEKHDGILEKLRDYRRQVAWVQVQTQEEIRDSLAAAIADIDSKLAQARDNVAPLEAAFDEADRASQEATEAHSQADAEVNAKQDKKDEVKRKETEVKGELQKLNAEQKEAMGASKNSNHKIKQKTDEIQAEKQRLADLDGGGAAARVVSLQKAKDAVELARIAVDSHQKTRAKIDSDLQTANLRVEEKQKAWEDQKADLSRRQYRADQFARERDQQDKGFHPALPQLLRAIENEPRFARKPIGPLGKHVRLLKPEWSSILEKSFGGSLDSFIVTSKRDMDILSELKKRVRYDRGMIYIGNTHPLHPREPDENLLTVLRAVHIDNELVRNQLIVQNSIEQTVLVPDMRDASDLLHRGDRARNVKVCFAMNPNKKTQGFKIGLSRSNEASHDPIHEFFGNARMRTDAESQLRSLRDAVQEAESQLRNLGEDINTLKDAVQTGKRTAAQHLKRCRELRIELQTAETKVSDLEDEISNDNVAGGKLEALQNSLTEAEDQKVLNEESYLTISTEVKKKSIEMRAATQTLRDLDAEIAILQENAAKLHAEAQKLSKKRAHALGEKNNAMERIKDGEADRQSVQRKLEAQEANIADYTQQAAIISHRVNIDAGATQELLEKKIERLHADYQRHHERIGGSREQIAEAAASTTKAYKEGTQQLRDLEELGLKLKASLLERRERWKKFRSFIAVRAKANFTYLLSERNFRGKLITDHREKLLELSIEPDITKRDGSGRGARTLSGGEKSFSQICLLLAIWEAMGSPIRCLDEFDVFMDAVNRSLSVNLLIDAARRSTGRQFVLISPGTKADIKTAPDVNVRE
jgi:structural maintenance of chromosomes protein 6